MTTTVIAKRPNAICGAVDRNLPNEPKSGTVDQILPNEPKFGTLIGILPNEPKFGALVGILPNEPNSMNGVESVARRKDRSLNLSQSDQRVFCETNPTFEQS